MTWVETSRCDVPGRIVVLKVLLEGLRDEILHGTSFKRSTRLYRTSQRLCYPCRERHELHRVITIHSGHSLDPESYLLTCSLESLLVCM